jgi:hypothetical protein
MNHPALEKLGALELRDKWLLICTGAEHDLVKLDDFVCRLTLNQV